MTDSKGRSILMYAAAGGSMITVRMLVEEFGADPVHKDGNGNTVMDWAIMKGRMYVADWLYRKFRDRFSTERLQKLMMGAVVRGHSHVAVWLLHHGEEEGFATVRNVVPELAVRNLDLYVLGWSVCLGFSVTEPVPSLGVLAAFSHGSEGSDECMDEKTLSVLKFLDRYGIDVTVADKEGRSVAMGLASLGKREALRWFVERFGVSELTRRSNTLLTPLMYASASGHLDLVKTMFGYGAGWTLGLSNTGGVSTMMLASLKGRVDVVSWYVTPHEQGGGGGSSLVAAVDLEGWTCVHHAASAGHTGIVEILLAAGPPDIVCLPDHRFRTPMYIAATNGRIEVLQWAHLMFGLENCGRTENNVGKGVLAAVLSRGHMDVANWLQWTYGKSDRFLYALLARDVLGRNALISAAAYGRLEAVQWVVHRLKTIMPDPEDVAHEINHCDIEQKTALSWAIRLGHTDVVKYLLENRATVPEIGDRNPNHVWNLLVLYWRRGTETVATPHLVSEREDATMDIMRILLVRSAPTRSFLLTLHSKKQNLPKDHRVFTTVRLGRKLRMFGQRYSERWDRRVENILSEYLPPCLVQIVAVYGTFSIDDLWFAEDFTGLSFVDGRFREESTSFKLRANKRIKLTN